MEDLINIFVKPSATFEHQRDKSFVMPVLVQMIVLTALAVALHNLMAPYWDAEFARQNAVAAAKMAAAGQQMPENAKAMTEKVQGFIPYLVGVVGPWLLAIFGGIVAWLCAKIVGAKMSVGQAMTVVAWAEMPAILAMVTMAVFGVLADPQTVRGMGDAQLGPARFVDPNTFSPMLLQFLIRLDVFAIWTVVLTAIGISVVARVPRATGFIAAVIRWGAVALLFGLCAGAGTPPGK